MTAVVSLVVALLLLALALWAVFVRDAFLTRRLQLIYDGNPPAAYELEPPAAPPAK